MCIKLIKIELKRYKNCKILFLDCLNNLNLFLGVNGSGKSNFFSFIYLLQQSCKVGIQYLPFDILYDLKSIFNNYSTEEDILVELSFLNESTAEVYKYSFTIVYKDAAIGFIHEKFMNSDNSLIFAYQNIHDRLLCFIVSNEQEAKLYNRLVLPIRNFIYNISFYSFTNFQQKDHILINKEIYENILYISEHYLECYKTIKALCRNIIGNFKDFSLDKINGQLFINMNEILIPLKHLSEGSYRFLYLLTKLDGILSKKTTMFILDEPELSLHYHGIEILADLINNYAQDKSVFLSTQSISLINFLIPKQVYLFHIDSDGNQVRLLSNKYIKLLQHYSLGELWLMNLHD